MIGDALRSTTMSETEVAVLLDRLVQSLCSPVNGSTVATSVGLRDGDRVNERINDLVTNVLAWRCHRLRQGLPNPAAQRKEYFTDPLIAQLAYRRNQRFTDPDSTKLNEQQIGLAIARAVTRKQPTTFIEADRMNVRADRQSATTKRSGPFLPASLRGYWDDYSTS